jgi:murein DD-endopeptidase MepM/ murein hydrolase activator NlpD
MAHIRPVATTAISDDFAAHIRRGSGLPGIDFKTSVGEAVWASADGVVTRANYTAASGNNIRIKHADGTNSYYLHLSAIWVTNGQTVAQGNQIGKTGNTGRSTGPHLHFSIANADGKLVDPMQMIGSPKPTPAPQRRTIKFGSRGAEVKYLQQRLGIMADGIFGPMTKRAVIAFQKSRLLAADGIVGPRTWQAIG